MSKLSPSSPLMLVPQQMARLPTSTATSSMMVSHCACVSLYLCAYANLLLLHSSFKYDPSNTGQSEDTNTQLNSVTSRYNSALSVLCLCPPYTFPSVLERTPGKVPDDEQRTARCCCHRAAVCAPGLHSLDTDRR